MNCDTGTLSISSLNTNGASQKLLRRSSVKKLAADIREKKLKEAEKADEAAAKEVSQPNEREKLDEAKAEAKKEQPSDDK